MRIKVEFECDVPDTVTNAEIIEWLRFNLLGGAMSTVNPLSCRDFEADFGSIDFEAKTGPCDDN